mmetsp:Transcript_4373/g.8410  ORF Transcript_4373/g.8410 Transcript_4373/m.8410 type:complete len:1214 (-) Transcript_4373:129-3770(-)
MSELTFNIAAALQSRRKEVTDKKESIAAKFETAKEQLQKLYAKSKPVRESPQQLEQKIVKLERKRTLTSLPLSEEKDILRQIERAKKTMIQAQENMEHESLIQEKKAEIEALKNEMRILAIQISELNGVIIKIELADRLKCSTHDIETKVIDCPVDKLGEIIGKGGARLKELQEQTGCIVEVDRSTNQIILKGNASSIQNAVGTIENIILTLDDEILLTSKIHSYLFCNGMMAFKELRNSHIGVYMDLSKETKKLKVRGKASAISALKDAISQLDVTMENIEMSNKEAGMVIGKGGSMIKLLMEKFCIGVEVKHDANESAIVEVVGTSSNVADAVEEINQLIHQNQDVKSVVVVNKLIKNRLLENAGEEFKSIQREMSKALDTKSIKLGFETKDKDTDNAASSALLEIVSIQAVHAAAVNFVKQKMDEYESNILFIHVDPSLTSKIVGKGGEKIKELKKLGKGSTIEIDRITGEVSVFSIDENTKHLVKAGIESIVAENHILKIPVEMPMIGLIYGNSGKELRSEIGSKNVTFMKDGSNGFILKGKLEDITDAARLLRDFMALNHTVEIKFDVDDTKVLMRKDSILSTFEKENNVKIRIIRSNRIIEIRGSEENTKYVATEIRHFLIGGNGRVALKIAVFPTIIGAVIGKNGSNISKFENEHEGVMIDVSSINHVLTIRGEENIAHQARRSVLTAMLKIYANDSVVLPSSLQKELSDKDSLLKITDGRAVNISFGGSQAKLRGNYMDVFGVKATLLSIINGSYESRLVLSPTMLDLLNADEKFLERVKNDTSVSLDLERDFHSVAISGKKSNVKRAKLQLFEFIEKSSPVLSSKVLVPKYLAHAMSTSALTDIMIQSGCDISYDGDLNLCLLHATLSPERLAIGVRMLEDFVKSCEKQVHVLHIDATEPWLANCLLNTYSNILRDIENKYECTIDVLKDEMLVAVTKKDLPVPDGARAALVALIDTARSQNVFIEIHESSMPQFIGQSSQHIKNFAKTYSVHIERVKKSSSCLHIHGSEMAVMSAVIAVKEWVSNWENKHQGTVVKVDPTITHLLMTSEKSKMAQEFGVKIDVNNKDSTVVVRGGKGNTQEKAVLAIKNLTSIASSHNNSKSVQRSRSGTPPNETNHESSFSQKVVVPSVIIENEKTDGIKFKYETKPQNASKLFKFLVSDDAGPVTTGDLQETWDASTVSSGIENAVEEGFFRSASGYTVRI